jgi:hypothetical protein
MNYLSQTCRLFPSDFVFVGIPNYKAYVYSGKGKENKIIAEQKR